MSLRGLAQPLVRVWRSKPTVLAATAVLSFAGAVSLMVADMRVLLDAAIDENWRGTYDILVRPGGHGLELEETHDLVEPNFLGLAGGGEGISSAQLEAIRELPGVGLAAPVMTVGLLRHFEPAPSIGRGGHDQDPTLYGVTFRSVIDDGIRERTLQLDRGLVLTGAEGEPVRSTWRGSIHASDYSESIIEANPLPSITGVVVAVDPVAEVELLGPSADFLSRLLETSEEERTVLTFERSIIPPELFPIGLYLDQPDAHAIPVVPLLVSERLYVDLAIHLEIETLGVLADRPDPNPDVIVDFRALEQRINKVNGSSVSTSLDATEALRPFVAPSLMIPWPGHEPSADRWGGVVTVNTPETIEPSLVSRPSYSAVDDRFGLGIPSYRIERLGMVSGDGSPAVGEPPVVDGSVGLARGAEAAYRTLTVLSAPVPSPVYAPIGTFDLGNVDVPDNPLNYVPLGIYNPPEATLVADPAGRPVEPRELRPTLNPLGLLASAPLAFTDLAGGAAVRGEVSIDAVRVRVSGVEGFSQEAREAILAVAADIAGLGLHVTVVAGSSPQPVEIYVPGYYPENEGLEADLGWVSQHWTTLGASQRVFSTFGAANWALLALAGISSVVFVFAAGVTRQAARVEEVALQESLGWSRARSRWWIVSEGLLLGLVVMVAALGVWMAWGRLGIVIPFVVGLAMLFPLSALLSSALVNGLAARLDGARTRIPWPTVRSAGAYGLRRAVFTPVRHLAIAGSMAAAGVATGVGVMISSNALDRSGPTLLASFTSGLLQHHHWAIIGFTALGGSFFAISLWRFDTGERRSEWSTLEALGRSRSYISWSRSVQSALPMLGAVLTAVLVLTLTAVLAEFDHLWVGAAAAAAAILIISTVGVATTDPRRKRAE